MADAQAQPNIGLKPPGGDFASFLKTTGIQSPDDMGKELTALEDKKREVRKPYADANSRLMAQNREIADNLAKLKPPPDPELVAPPEAPDLKQQDPTQAMGSLASVLAMFGSLKTRAPLTSALNSAAASMQAFHKGDQERVKLEQEKWRDKLEEGLRKNQEEMQKYSLALEKANFDMAKVQPQFRAIAAEYQNNTMLAQIETGDLDAQYKVLETVNNARLKLSQLYLTDQEKRDALKMHHEDKQMQIAATERAHNDTLAMQKEIAGMRYGAGGGAAGAGTLSEKYQSDPEYKQKVDFWATQIKNGGSLPARFAQVVGKNFSADVYTAAAGGNPNDVLANRVTMRQMNSEAQKLGTQSASVAIANKELQKFIPLAEGAIDNVPRSGWRPINQLIAAGENTWSPEQKSLVIANRSVLNAYAQLIQRGAPTVHSLTEAESLLSTADSPAVYKAAMTQLKREGVAAEEGLIEAHDDLMKRVKAIGAGDQPPARRSTDPKPDDSQWSVVR